MEELQIKVEKAHPIDFGRGIIRLDPSTLLSLQLSPGDIVQIEGKRTTAAKVWRADRQDWGQGIARIDGYTRQNAGVGIGERVTIRKVEATPAEKVLLAPPEGVVMEFGENTGAIIKHNILKRPLLKEDIVPIVSSMGQTTPGSQAIPLIAIETQPEEGVLIITDTTDIQLQEKPVIGYEDATRGIAYEDIGGLRDEIQRVREMIELPLKHHELFQRLNIEPPKGVILYGPPGTGKTLIAKAVANESRAHFLYIAGPEIMGKFYGESEERLRRIFEEADENTPSIIFIDEIDSIAPKRENATGEVERRVVAQLLTLMDGMDERKEVVVIGATNRVDSIDPALRRPGRFDREIEIGVPDSDDRLEILQIHTRGMPLSEEIDENYFRYLAEYTQAFVGADMLALVQEASMRALRRILPDINLDEEKIPEEVLEKLVVTAQDFEDALKEVEPSAMREVLVEIPSVGWDDVGGLEEAEQELREAVEWPLKWPEKIEKMGVKPPTGILLYGPPGTGKTLLAQAVANEANANFISIKGPQIFSKYVGESEKAIRETFKKARQVAPCIIFFDEIDSISSTRQGGSDEGGRVTEQVVNQLLTEMDGLESLNEVVVIAATNRPDLIDPALLRSGRFDRLVMVTPTTHEGRINIFNIHTRNMPLDTDVNISDLAGMTDGYVGADIEAVCREAAMLALRENFENEKVSFRHFTQAFEKVKPTVNEDMIDFYNRLSQKLKGGTRKAESSSYTGYI
ncbi:transitional endoplasmic reticulum ATPase [Methanohalophilus levihalophilus]|uniref:CDC48 family AAA ATPase n=1 Tax=Methanohalophilus levihalophilus TaxID=1431282 RepID=UPI001AE16556|nr:CDC48 family AAA ATPase [Methanohalophilus levihalophilus]MBP2030118.1 transitional endoplasmic reticulum ATPase [Methanohalophilus levihalophilus]